MSHHTRDDLIDSGIKVRESSNIGKYLLNKNSQNSVNSKASNLLDRKNPKK